MTISDQFATARLEAANRGWTIEDMSFDSSGLHLRVAMDFEDGHVRWLPGLYQRLVNRFGPR